MDYSPEIQQQQCLNVANALNDSIFEDVTFIIGTEQNEYKANRIFLSLISDVFRAMLFGKMQESKPNAVITISDIEPKAFESILNYAYCKDPNINVSNIISTKQICRKYQISKLSLLCDSYFKSNQCLNTQNICSLFNGAVNLKINDYIKICQQYIMTNYHFKPYKMLSTKGFMNMGLAAMQLLLQFDYLYMKEEVLWEAVLKWSKKNNCSDLYGAQPMHKKRKLNNTNTNNENCLLKAVCPCIRFGLMDKKYFQNKVKTMNVLTKDELISILSYINGFNDCGKFTIRSRISNVLSSDFFAYPHMNDDGSINELIWECGIPGKKESAWEGGVYPLTITFYAKISPRCIFNKGLFHPNVYVSGWVCIGVRRTVQNKREWKADIHTVKWLLLEIQELMICPNNDEAAAKEPYELYKKGEGFYWDRVGIVAKRYQINLK